MLLPNIKVLVIDDIPKEVEKLLNILNKEGIPFNYYKSYSELPINPLSGIRFLFLDFELGTDGQSNKNKVSKLMEFVHGTIDQNNGPYIIIAWTRYNVLLNIFKEELMKNDYILKPLAIIDLEKQDCMDNINKIRKRIKEKITDKQILELLLNWENNAHGASFDVLRKLSDISRDFKYEDISFDEYSNKINSELERHIYWVAKSYLGQNIKPNQELLIAAQFSLTPLFQDFVETRIKNHTSVFENLTDRISLNKDNEYSAKESALMNTSFLLITQNLDSKIQPSNIYMCDEIFKKIKCKKKECYSNKTKPIKKEIINEIFNGKLKEYPNKQELISKSKLLLIEITPECDYVQKNMKCSKFVLGILWPMNISNDPNISKKLIKGDFIYKPLPILYKNEIYYLTFNSRYYYNINLEVFDKIKPILKTRKEFLVDVQHWFSKQLSRPGKTEF